ncbi:hypothetical protein ABGB18_12065 [Nonomuraea sp. B12E4]|uniref:hypothetical protein n=1 Tax=Nonomuraea sp. B12E4 TaxID=3153564 RepID=UPI00325C7675
MTTFAIPPPDPDDAAIARELAALERHLLDQPSAPPAASDDAPTDTPTIEDASHSAGRTRAITGETRRVRRLRQQVAEAHRLADLQDDDAPLLIDTPKVRRRRRKAHEAARLHELAQDPTALAYRDQKVRRTITAMVMAAAGIALAVSSIGVQASVAKALELKAHTIGWWAAFGVEPALSLPLLATVAVQAYCAMRGQVIDRKSDEGRKMFRTEALLLGLTLVLNCWPALALDSFDLLSLIVHSLGPVAAVTAIWVLPALWSVLALLPAGDPVAPLTVAWYSANTEPPKDHGKPFGGVRKGLPENVHRQRLHALIAAGQVPPQPSARVIQQALGCRTEVASTLRNELRGTPDNPGHGGHGGEVAE